MEKRRFLLRSEGYTIVEAVVAVAILMIVAGAVYEAFVAAMRTVEQGRVVLAVNALANEQFEIARNLPFSDVGISGGWPPGRLLYEQTLSRSGDTFRVTTTVRNVDDPFDGTIGGAPNDTSPADYKLVALDIACTSCQHSVLHRYHTWVAPAALEGTSTNGALFVRVFDAMGQPVVDADVRIENNQATPAFVVNDRTNNQGMLQIVDILPGTQAYEITVSKAGYSTEQTHTGGPWIPVAPHANVVAGLLTQTSFVITPVSTLEVRTSTAGCAPIGSVPFSMSGAKKIGTGPDVLKYTEAHTTSVAGSRIVGGLEADTYTINLAAGAFDLIGSIPPLPLTLDQDTTQEVRLILTPATSQLLLVSVRDATTGLPLSDANVHLTGTSYDETRTTGSGYLGQTDWSGPSGQATSTENPAGYFASEDTDRLSPAGDLTLRNSFGTYVADGYLISATFDTGAASNFSEILWQPEVQPSTSTDSIRLQLASSVDGATWDFVGPDGTASTYYTLADRNIGAHHDGHRYIRYKVYLSTDDTTQTPRVSDVQFAYTSSCIPPGQAFFTGLAAEPYNLSVSRAGYQTQNIPVAVTSSWQNLEVLLSP